MRKPSSAWWPWWKKMRRRGQPRFKHSQHLLSPPLHQHQGKNDQRCFHPWSGCMHHIMYFVLPLPNWKIFIKMRDAFPAPSSLHYFREEGGKQGRSNFWWKALNLTGHHWFFRKVRVLELENIFRHQKQLMWCVLKCVADSVRLSRVFLLCWQNPAKKLFFMMPTAELLFCYNRVQCYQINQVNS